MDRLDGSAPMGMSDRIKAVLLRPAEAWPAIAAEPSSPGELIARWAIPLAAIGPVSSFIHGQLFGYGMFGFKYKPGLIYGLSSMVVTYILGLAGVIALALIADWLAPRFGGTANRTAAFKLVIYGSFAAWLAGIFQLVPGLGVLALAGLYSLYLYYSGAAPLMKVPAERSAGYTAITIVCAVLLYFVVGMVSSAFLGLFGLGTMADMTGAGSGSVNTARIQGAAGQLQAASNAKPADPAAIAALLPAALGGYTRTALDSGAMGPAGAQAEGTYTSGDKTIKLKVLDSPGVGAIANIGAAFGVSENHEDASGYERTSSDGGQMRIEKWDTSEGRGEFSQQIAGRFIVSAEGEAGSIDELKAAVAAISPGRLAALVK